MSTTPTGKRAHETPATPHASREDLSWAANFDALVELGAELGINPSYLIRGLTQAQLGRVLRAHSHRSRLKAAQDDAAADADVSR